MKIISKLKNNNGSAMILAIILMFLVSIVIVMFSSQVSNGFRVTNRNYEDLRAKYILEAGIDNAIGTVLTNIEYEYLYGAKYLDWKKDKDVIFEIPKDGIIGKAIEDDYPLELNITNDIIQNKLNYQLKEPIKICINLKVKKYQVVVNSLSRKTGKENGNGNGNGNQNQIIEKYYIYGTDSKENEIEVNTKVNGKKYNMKSRIKFDIEDLKTGKVKYTVESWNKK